MSKGKYPRLLSPQMEVIVFTLTTLQMLFTTRVVLKIGEYHSDIFPSFSWKNIQSRDVFK